MGAKTKEKKVNGYTIESGVERPPHHRLKYPWPDMDAGDSVFIECAETKSAVNSVRSAAKYWLGRNRPDLDCEVHKVSGGARVWFFAREES